MEQDMLLTDEEIITAYTDSGLKNSIIAPYYLPEALIIAQAQLDKATPLIRAGVAQEIRNKFLKEHSPEYKVDFKKFGEFGDGELKSIIDGYYMMVAKALARGKPQPGVLGLCGMVYDLAEKRLAQEIMPVLIEADEIICQLCKRLNPQHETMDNGKGCEWCKDREERLALKAKYGGE